MKFHCQICGRDIKAAKGLIAHHGYKRPGHGWQTGSCFGARFKTYEESSEALPIAIDRAQNALDSVQETLTQWLKDPPQVILFYPKMAWGQPIELQRPEPFDRNNLDRYRPRTYTNEYNHSIYSMEQRIKTITEELQYMRQRLTAWKQCGEFKFKGEWQYFPLTKT